MKVGQLAEILMTNERNEIRDGLAQVNVDSVIEILKAISFNRPENSNPSILFAWSSDLISDVLAFTTLSSHNMALLTGLCTLQVIRTASLLDIPLVILVRGKRPSEEMIEFAKKSSIILLGCEKSMFYASALLFNAGVRPLDSDDEFRFHQNSTVTI